MVKSSKKISQMYNSKRFWLPAAIWPVVFTVMLLVPGACKNSSASVTEEEENLPPDIVELRDDQARLANIEFGKVEMHHISETIPLNGKVTVAPGDLATICIPMGGFIKHTVMMPGDKVGKGQVLAVVDNPDFIDIQQNYLEARNKLSFAEADFKRHSELYKDDVYSEQNIQEVTVNYNNLKALVRSYEQKLLLIGIDPSKLTADNISSSVNVTSPIDGYITSVKINTGKYINPADVMFEVVNRKKLLLELTLFEKDADKIRPGQDVVFHINNESEEHHARVSRTGKSIGEDNTFTIYADVESMCENVLPGMYVNASVIKSDNLVTSLPSEAIVSFDDKNYIFVYERDKTESGMAFTEYRMVEVGKGVTSSGYTEVKLPEGFDLSVTRVVFRGAYNLLSAMKNAGEMAC